MPSQRVTPREARASGITPSTTRGAKHEPMHRRDPGALQSESFDIGWRPIDPERDVTQISTEIEKQKAYRDGRD